MDKPSSNEEEYFAREEMEAKRRLAHKQARELAEHEKQERKALHFMKCPRCGMDLHTVPYEQLQVDTCFNCDGVWLDKAQLTKIAPKGHASPVVEAVLNWFDKE